MHPWSLADGILLEDTGFTLRWGTPFDSLCTLQSPEVNRQPTSIHPTWHRRRILGGLIADVGACRILEEPNPRAYHIYLPVFHWATALLCESFRSPAAAQLRMRELHDRIASATATSATCYPDYKHRLPAIMWDVGSIRIGLGPRCLHAVEGRSARLETVKLAITITDESHGFEALRSEANAIRQREGRGAERDGVAWHQPYDDSQTCDCRNCPPSG